jgi:hypothetical protein
VFKNHSVESKLIERNFVRGSLLLFIWFLLFFGFIDYLPGPVMIWYSFLIINFGFIISGIALTIEARKRKPIFWILLGATLLACSFMGIPLLMAL